MKKKINPLVIMYKKLKNISLAKKVILVFVTAIILPSIYIISYSYSQSKNNFTIEIQKNNYQTLLQLKENMLLKVNSTNDIASNLSLDYQLQRFLKRDFIMNTENILVYIDNLIPKFIHTESFYRQLIDNITIYTTNKSIPEQSGKLYHEDNIIRLEWYQEFKNGNDDHIWLYPQKSLFFDSIKDNTNFFLLVKKIISSEGNYLGIITIAINEKNILPINYTTSEIQDIIVVDSDFKIIFRNNPNELTDEYNQICTLINEKQSNYLINNNVLYTYVTVEPIAIRIISKKSLDQLFKKRMDENGNIIIVIILGVFISTLLITFIIQIIFKRLHKIVKIMDTISNGKFDILIPVESEDEVGLLSKDFNRLIVKINDQINDLVKRETEQKNAQLLALQYQINPHFLYNTIEFFKSKMELAGEFQTAETIVDFANILRYNISSNSIYATIKSEISNVENYMNIQRVRFNGQVSLSINLTDEIQEKEIIKFIFQPIVENSIKHGMKALNQHLHITINSKIKEDNLFIIFSDDGNGIDQETLYQLNINLESNFENENLFNFSNHIGLYNINNRLKLFYGRNYCIKLDSEKDIYTKTIITIPYK